MISIIFLLPLYGSFWKFGYGIVPWLVAGNWFQKVLCVFLFGWESSELRNFDVSNTIIIIFTIMTVIFCVGLCCVCLRRNGSRIIMLVSICFYLVGRSEF